MNKGGKTQHCFKKNPHGTWVAQLVRCQTLTQVMIPRFVGLSPTLVSVMKAQSLEPARDSVSPSLSVPPLLMLCLSLSRINNKHGTKKDRSMEQNTEPINGPTNIWPTNL